MHRLYRMWGQWWGSTTTYTHGSVPFIQSFIQTHKVVGLPATKSTPTKTTLQGPVVISLHRRIFSIGSMHGLYLLCHLQRWLCIAVPDQLCNDLPSVMLLVDKNYFRPLSMCRTRPHAGEHVLLRSCHTSWCCRHHELCSSTVFHPYTCCTQSFNYTALATDMHDTLRRIALVKCGKHLSSPCILHLVMPTLGTKLDHACATDQQHQIVMTEHLSTFLARWLV